MKKSLFGKTLEPEKYHSIIIGTSLLFGNISYFKGYQGLNIFGTCSIKSNSEYPIIGLVALGIAILVFIITFSYSFKKIKDLKSS